MPYKERNSYLKQLYNQRDNYSNSTGAINPSDDSNNLGAELTSFASLNTPLESPINADKVTETSNERNNYQKVLDTAEELQTNVIGGVFNAADSIWDGIVTAAAKVGSWFGGSTDWANDLIEYDWSKKAKEAVNILNPSDIFSGDVFSNKYWEDYGKIFSTDDGASQISQERSNNSFVSNTSDSFQSGYKSFTEGVGELLPSLALAVGTGGTSLTTQAGIQGGVASVKGLGSGTEKALNEGADFQSASNYGLIRGAISGATTAATVGIGGSILNNGGQTVVSKLSSQLGEKISSVFTNSSTAEVLIAKASEILMKAGIDSVESGVDTLLDPVLKQITYDSNAIQNAYGNSDRIQNTLANMGSAMLISGLTSTIMGLAREVVNGVQAGSFDKYKENYYVNKKVGSNYQKAKKYSDEYDKLVKEYYKKSGLESGNLVSEEEFISMSNKLNEDIQKLNSKYDVDSILKSISNKDYSGTNAEKYQTQIKNTEQSISDTLRSRRIDNALPKAVAFAYIQKSGWKMDAQENEPKSAKTAQTYTSPDNLLQITTDDNGTILTTPDTPNDPISLVKVGENDTDIALKLENANQVNAIMNYVNDHPENDLPTNIVYGEEQMELTKANLEAIYQEALSKQKPTQIDEEFQQKLKKRAEEKQKEDLGIIPQGNEKSNQNGVYASKTDKVTFEGTSKNEYTDKKSKVELIKGYANAYTDKVINAKTTHELASGIISGISSVLPKGTTISFDTKGIANDLFETFNLTRGANKEKYKNEVEKVATAILNSSLEYDSGVTDKSGVSVKSRTSLLDVLKATDPTPNRADSEYTQTFVDLINDIMVDKSKDTKIKKMQDFYTNKIAKLQNYFRLYQATNIQATNTKLKVSKFLQKYENFSFTGVLNDTLLNYDDAAAFITPILKGLRQLKLVKSTNNFSANSVKKLLEHIGGYNKELTTKYPVVSYDEGIEDSIKYLQEASEQWEDKHRLTVFETKMVSDLVDSLTHSINDALSEKGRQLRLHREQANADVFVKSRYNKNIKNNPFTQEARNATSFNVTLKNLFGESSDVYKFLYTDIREAYNNTLLKGAGYQNLFENAKAENGITDKMLEKKVEFKGLTMTLDELGDIYLTSQTDDSAEVLLDGGMWIKDSKGRSKRLVLTQEDIDSIPKLFEKEMGDFFGDVLSLYNIQLREAKNAADEKHRGVTGNVLDTTYYPLYRADTKSNQMAQSSIQNMTSLDTSNVSLNKRRKKNTAYAVIIEGVSKKYQNYISSLARYECEYEALKNADMFLNTYSINPEDGTRTTMRAVLDQTIPGFMPYLNYYIDQVAGVNTSKDIKTPWTSQLFSNAVNATLAGNISVVLKQTASLPTILNAVKTSSWFKGMAYGFKNLKDYKSIKTQLMMDSGVLAKRWGSFEVISAKTLSNNLSKFAEWFGIPMEKMDEAVIITVGYGSALAEAQVRGYGKIGTPENYTEAVKILEEIVLSTQSNNDKLQKSPNSAGKTGTTRKILSIFTSDLQNKFNYIVELTNGKKYSQKRVEDFESELSRIEKENEDIQDKLDNPDKILEEAKNDAGEAQKKTEEYKEKQKSNERNSKYFKDRVNKEKDYIKNINPRRAKLAVSLILSGIMVAGIDELVKRIYGRKGWNENTLDDFAKNVAIESTIANLPYISQILNAVEYNSDISTFEATQINQIVDIISSATNFKDGFDMNKLKSMLISISKLGGSLSGIPITNLYNLGMGLYKNVSSTGYKTEALVKGYSSSYSTNLFNEAVSSGNTKAANGYLDFLLGVYKGGAVSTEAENEITRLSKDGYSVLPYSVMTTYENENGETVSLTSVQSSNFTKYYFEASKQMEKMIKTTEYQKLNDEYKAKAIKKLYSSYYSYAKIKAVNLTDSSKLGNLIVNTSNGASMGKLSAIMTQCNALNTKDEIMAYLNKTTLTYNEKLMVCQLLGYSLTSTNELRVNNYIKSLAK